MSQCKAANFFGSSLHLSLSCIRLRNGVHVLDLPMHVRMHAENSHPSAINVGTQEFAYVTTSLQSNHYRTCSIIRPPFLHRSSAKKKGGGAFN